MILLIKMNTAYFPISKPMVGSVIPGILYRVQTKIANFPDGRRDPRIKKHVFKDPVTKFPDMNNQHGASHPILEKLRQMMSANGPRHPHAAMGQLGDPRSIQTMEGYEPQRENLDWRRT